MGQAEQDLPASTNAPADGAAPGADDLLAQLAGEDIDKLLAEADAESNSAPAASAPFESAVYEPGKGTPEELSHDLDELLKESSEKGLPPTTALPPENPASEPAAADAQTKQEEQQSPGATADPIETIESQSTAQAPDVSATTSEPALLKKRDQATVETPPETLTAASSAEPGVSALPAGEVSARKSDPTPAPADAATAADDSDESGPFYVRILEFLNSPLDAFPDHVREIVGKIALVTLLNAVAVIGYVMFIRRK